MSVRGLTDIRALWFGGEASLLGHLHTPRSSAIDIGVVICGAPFGYENICGHRGLRVLGECLAQSGIAALRFDFPGIGDSDGTQRLQAWKTAVKDAVVALRDATHCAGIGIIGVGLGGTMTVNTVDDGLDVDKMVLWGAPARGRTWLRQQRAYHRLAAIKVDPAAVPSPPSVPEGMEELSGFQMTSELANELMALDVNRVEETQWPAGRRRPATLMIPRNAGDAESDLSKALRVRGMDVIAEQGDGFDAMFAEPQLSVAPEAIFASMCEWLAEGAAHRAPYAAESRSSDGASTQIGGQGLVVETARYSEGEGGLLFSIETRPSNREPDSTWLIFQTGGAQRHIGPNRIWVRLARELAAAGYASLRLDGRSVGDSDGDGNSPMADEKYYQEHIYDDAERIMDIGVAAGAKRFVMVGICSGAATSYYVAGRRSDVGGIVLINPLQLRNDSEDDARAKVQHAQKWSPRKDLWADPETYSRLLKGELPIRNVLKILFVRAGAALPFRAKPAAGGGSYVATGFYELTQKPVEVDIFLSGQDSIATSFLERHFGVGLEDFDRPRLRLHRVPYCDHTVRPLFAQERLFQVVRDALKRVAKGGMPNRAEESLVTRA